MNIREIAFLTAVAALAASCTSANTGRPATTLAPAAADAPPTSKLVAAGPAGRLTYTAYSERGDSLPDFSHCGYGGGGAVIPRVPAKATVTAQPDSSDDTERLQAAIDAVSNLPLDRAGWRGAVLLKRGRYRIAGSLKIRASGVVLRGEGQTDQGTVLVAAGNGQRTLITVQGSGGPREVSGTRQGIATDYVPVGARTFEVVDGSKFKPGDSVIVSRNGNQEWIHEIHMDSITPRAGNPSSTHQWSPFALDFDRVITAVAGNRITVDAPIVCAIEARWGGGQVWRYEDSGRIERSGVEDLRGDSEFDPAIKEKQSGQEYFADEAHAVQLLSFNNAKSCWARNLTAVHFYHGVSLIDRNAKWITVQDCSSLDPVSKITGGRRYPFNINGQLSLVQRCYSRDARHAFVFGSHVAGPNVFRDCASERDHATSEPHHRWSVGGLYDGDHAQIIFQDRQWMGSGHGWAGANYVAWNCEGSLVCQQPPTAQNFAIGFVGERRRGAFERPAGWWESEGRHVTPKSLYLKQLEDRLGPQAVAAVTARTADLSPSEESTSNPSKRAQP